MRNRILPISVILLSALIGCCLLSSCGDNVWWPGPPAGWNTYYDSNLTGTWELVQANGVDVKPGDANYMEFYGNGSGRYYYYSNGILYNERIVYYCQTGSSNNKINIQYADGRASTMNYWFTGRYNQLWLQWNTSSGGVTYVYDYTNRLP